MLVTASRLRADVYRLLDLVLETGEVIEIERHGRRLRIVADDPPSKLDRLVQRPVIDGDPEDLVHRDWSDEWTP